MITKIFSFGMGVARYSCNEVRCKKLLRWSCYTGIALQLEPWVQFPAADVAMLKLSYNFLKDSLTSKLGEETMKILQDIRGYEISIFCAVISVFIHQHNFCI